MAVVPVSYTMCRVYGLLNNHSVTDTKLRPEHAKELRSMLEGTINLRLGDLSTIGRFYAHITDLEIKLMDESLEKVNNGTPEEVKQAFGKIWRLYMPGLGHGAVCDL